MNSSLIFVLGAGLLAAIDAAMGAEHPMGGELFAQSLSQQAATRAFYDRALEERAYRRRLDSIVAALEVLADDIGSSDPRIASNSSIAAKAIDFIEKALPEAHLPPAAIVPARARIDCLRRLLANSGDTRVCRDAAEDSGSSKRGLESNDDGDRAIRAPSGSAVADSRTSIPSPHLSSDQDRFDEREAGASPATAPENNLRRVRIGIFGQGVDTDLGRLFKLLAERDPEMLRPIPYEREFVRQACINRHRYPWIIDTTVKNAEYSFRAMLAEAERSYSAGGEVARFLLLQSELADRRARTGLDVPEDLERFTAEDASRLITREFVLRYGLEGYVSQDIIPALRNLSHQLVPEQFLRVIQKVTDGAKDEINVGRALAEMNLNAEALWSAIYTETAKNRECDLLIPLSIYEAYGLVYRSVNANADFARDTLDHLKRHTGFPSVPGLTMVQAERRFIEWVAQSCENFGPQELLDPSDPDGCNNLLPDKRYVVFGGGVEIEFELSTEEQERMLNYMEELASIPRDGDILRWTFDADAPIRPQASFVSDDEKPTKAADRLRCVISLSNAKRDDNEAELVQHITGYRQYFFPSEPKVAPSSLSIIYLFDEFGGADSDEFRKEVLNSIWESQADVSQPLGEQTAAADLDAVKKTAIGGAAADFKALCDQVRNQLSKVNRARVVSHGEYIRSLLIEPDSSLAAVRGLGLLNPDGAYKTEAFDLKIRFHPVSESLSKLREHIRNLSTDYKDTKRLAFQDPNSEPTTVVINISLGESYLYADETTSKSVDNAIKEMLNYIAPLELEALFIVAAGQRKSGDTASIGEQLNLMNPNELKVKESACSYFPACFSDLPNVITVGAVKASAKDGFKIPALIPWANYGSAVTLAAPGEAVLGREFGYVMNDTLGLDKLSIASLRDGTSAATVFVTALAARIASLQPTMRATEIKERLVATAGPYFTSDGMKTVFSGTKAKVGIFAGVIDPSVALRNPHKAYVRYKHSDEAVTEYKEINLHPDVDTKKRFFLFHSTLTSEKDFFVCDWRDLLRVHIRESTKSDVWKNPIYEGAIVCRLPNGSPKAAWGYFGTEDVKQNPCISRDRCFVAVEEDGTKVCLSFAKITDIYMPTIYGISH